ncbi:recombinase RecA [Archaeoglobales archaeon]|nr:MAG: recombinase RecA [Archaeoglobales archaeon]
MKLPFGIEKLDDVLGGGLDKDTINLVIGRSGAGKTILASHWAAEGARNGENVVYLATTMGRKSCESYLGKMKFMEGVFDRIHWRFVRIDAKFLLPLTPEKLEESVVATIKTQPRDVDRIVVDSVTDMDKALGDPVLYRLALRYLSRLFQKNDVTALFVEEAPYMQEWSETKNLAESVILLDILRVPDGYARALRILKKYRTAHPLDYIPFEITDQGIEIRDGKFVRRNYEFEYRA